MCGVWTGGVSVSVSVACARLGEGAEKAGRVGIDEGVARRGRMGMGNGGGNALIM